MENTEALERAAKLLLEGAVMLRESCPVCVNPLYKKRDGSLYCSKCDKKVVREEDLQQEKESAAPPETNSPIQSKIDALSTELQNADDPERIVELSEMIRKLEKIRDS